MNRADTITTTTIDRWLLPHIAGLLAYAETDHFFAITLATWLDDERWSITPTVGVTPSRYLTPQSRDAADDTIDWLMHELATHPEARIARSALLHWAGAYVVPQNILADLDTLLLAEKPLKTAPSTKRTRSQLQIVIDAEWQETQPYDRLSQATHNLTQQLIATELRKAGGKIGSLHPDTAEWCMAGSATAVHAAPQATLEAIATTVTNHDLHHVSTHDNHGLTMLAISPHVCDSLVNEQVKT